MYTHVYIMYVYTCIYTRSNALAYIQWHWYIQCFTFILIALILVASHHHSPHAPRAILKSHLATKCNISHGCTAHILKKSLSHHLSPHARHIIRISHLATKCTTPNVELTFWEFSSSPSFAACTTEKPPTPKTSPVYTIRDLQMSSSSGDTFAEHHMKFSKVSSLPIAPYQMAIEPTDEKFSYGCRADFWEILKRNLAEH